MEKLINLLTVSIFKVFCSNIELINHTSIYNNTLEKTCIGLPLVSTLP